MSDSGNDGDGENSDNERVDKVPAEFIKIVKDLLKDLLITFPEYEHSFKTNPILNNILSNENCPKKIEELFNYCFGIFPERFFDILYQNEEIFTNNEINTEFLPSIEFKDIWKEEIGDKTRSIIWKYLQLILFSVVGNQTKGRSFGDTAKFFEAIDESEFKSKLEETINKMTDFFDSSNNEFLDSSGINVNDIPSAEKLHEHISGLLDGHLGRLAKEIAEETANEMNLDLNNVSSVNDVFKKLFQNPGKLMKIVKKVGSKLDDKLKSGEIKESDLLKEATELMGKMGKTPGMKNMNKLFAEMGLPTGRKAKVNKSAFNAHMKKQLRLAKMRERMKSKVSTQTPPPHNIIENNTPLSWIPENYTKQKKKKRKKKKKKK